MGKLLATVLVHPAFHYGFAAVLGIATAVWYFWTKNIPSAAWLGFILGWAGIGGVTNDRVNSPPIPGIPSV